MKPIFDFEEIMKAIIVDRKINVAVVGCGRISKNHLDAIQKNADNLQLVALCDVDEIVLKEKCDEFDVAGYIRLEEMLRAEQIDLVILATPSGLHSPQAIACAELGVHVLTEKPMATNWKDGLAMVNKFNSSLFFANTFWTIENITVRKYFSFKYVF